MGRFVTPQGVVIEMGDEAARVVGYKSAAEEKSEPKKAPAKRAAKSESDK